MSRGYYLICGSKSFTFVSGYTARALNESGLSFENCVRFENSAQEVRSDHLVLESDSWVRFQPQFDNSLRNGARGTGRMAV